MPSTSRTNQELAPLIQAHIDKILHNNNTDSHVDYSPSGWDLTKPTKELAGTIDHTLLKPTATKEQVQELCKEAEEYGFASCCINPIHIETVAATSALACTVISFPLGALPPAMKAQETTHAISLGAKEIDMVISIGHLKNQDYAHILKDISAVVQAAEKDNVPVKVIFETSMLTDEEKVAACWLSCEAGAAFVKTSTGFGGGGATVEDVRLMKRSVEHAGGKVKVKASGGIRTFEDCVAMIKAGATRIGASAGVEIMKGGTGKDKY